MARAKKTSARVNKSAFVLGLPARLSPKEVVRRGKARGVALTAAFVERVRAAKSKKPANKSSRLPAKPPVKAQRRGANVPRSSRVDKVRSEKQFVALALDLGLARAGELLTQLRKRLAKIGV